MEGTKIASDIRSPGKSPKKRVVKEEDGRSPRRGKRTKVESESEDEKVWMAEVAGKGSPDM